MDNKADPKFADLLLYDLLARERRPVGENGFFSQKKECPGGTCFIREKGRDIALGYDPISVGEGFVLIRIPGDSMRLQALAGDPPSRYDAIDSQLQKVWEFSPGLEYLLVSVDHGKAPDGKEAPPDLLLFIEREKIREVTDKLSKLTKPELITIHGDSRMINLNKSK